MVVGAGMVSPAGSVKRFGLTAEVSPGDPRRPQTHSSANVLLMREKGLFAYIWRFVTYTFTGGHARPYEETENTFKSGA